ncbi:MAG TPA: hypothetical protein VMY76_12140 [Gemmatimonadales bacterium]|nr:hypothetical protein [Gemmatimonadales bacterium]
MLGRSLLVGSLLAASGRAAVAQTAVSSPPAVKLSGYLQARETYQEGIGLNGTVNRARLTAWGAAPVRRWLQPVVKYEWFNRVGVPGDAQRNRAWTAAANLFPWGKATRLTIQYVSRLVGEPGIRRSQMLAQAQLIF